MLSLLVTFYLGGLLVRLTDEIAIGELTVTVVAKAVIYPIDVVKALTPMAVSLYNTIATIWRKPNVS